MVNRLSKETSPYLQQHKDNPVDWWPYGDDAFNEARKLDRPVFISIGYSTCHWCHVMARESFSDPDTADFMNNNYINIKIDREEYPSVDKAYQEMYQLLARRGGGWPLSVFAHPDGSPFFIGTYFPNKAKFGMHSFMDLNRQITQAWNEDRETLDQQATGLIRGLRSLGEHMYQGVGKLDQGLLYKEIIGLQSRFDKVNGGIGSAPKFPRVSVLRFLFQEGIAKNLEGIIEFVHFSFTKMSLGGIYDQLGGGFARYAVDDKWLIPHFEKMLYDNAMLLHLGSELYSQSKDAFIEFILRDVISFLAREMRSPNKAFYSAINAESEGQEGKFYVWFYYEIEEILGKDTKLASLRFGISKKGNFTDPHHSEIKGMNILHIAKGIPKVAEELKMDETEVINRLNVIRIKLFTEREKRIKPSVDTKILVSWNSLAIRALLVAAESLDFPEAAVLAQDALQFILDNLVRENHIIRNYHTSTESQNERQIEGILDDYSFLIAALIQAFEYFDDWNYIVLAKKLLALADEKFFDPEAGVYFLNSKSESQVLGRIIQVSDDSMPSGLGLMPLNLFKLGKYTENEEMLGKGLKVSERFVERINDYPGAMNNLMISSTPYIRHPIEIVVINDPENLLNAAYSSAYLSHRLIYRWNATNKNDGRPEWQVLEHRTNVDKETIFICEGMTCSLPMNDPESVSKYLEQVYKSKDKL